MSVSDSRKRQRKFTCYSKRAKEQYANTPEYKEFEEKCKNWMDDDQQNMLQDFIQIFQQRQ